MNTIHNAGKKAIGSRLRLLTAKVTENAAEIYKLYKIDFSPKWFPVFFVLSEEGKKTITQLANEIQHSQPSVTKIVKELATAGLVKLNLETTDKRKNMVSLTKKGEKTAVLLEDQYQDVEIAIENMIEASTHNIWEAIKEWEFLLEQKSLLDRVKELKKIRESKNVQIVPYEAKYKTVFRTLNEEWITSYFEMEEADHKALKNPKEYILDPGGKIFVALYKDEPLGVCALLKIDHSVYDFELAKMAVSPKAQGKNIGYLLGKAIVEAAKNEGASKLYLESNTILKPAIHLYQKLGFKKIVGLPTPYKRCNIQMELEIES